MSSANAGAIVSRRGAVVASTVSEVDLSPEALWDADLSGPEYDDFDTFSVGEDAFFSDSRNFSGQVI